MNSLKSASDVKLKALADQVFDNLLASKEQNAANKTRITELRTVFDKIKQNPIRFLDLMITIGKNNKALSEEAMKIIDFSQFDQCINMLIDLILQRLDYWMQMRSSTTTTLMTTLSSSGPTMTAMTTASVGTNPTQTATQTPTTSKVSTTSTTTIAYTTPPILAGIFNKIFSKYLQLKKYCTV